MVAVMGEFLIGGLWRKKKHGMVFSMATTKITVTLPTEQVAEIGALVAAGRTASVSAFVKHAVSVGLMDQAGFRQMLDEALEQTGGPLTDEEREWADEILTPKQTPRNRTAA